MRTFHRAYLMGATDTRITSVDGTLRLGSVYARRPAVAINESLPLPDIGVDVIEQFVMEFDRVHQRVGFQPVRRVKGVLTSSAPDKAGCVRRRSATFAVVELR